MTAQALGTTSAGLPETGVPFVVRTVTGIVLLVNGANVVGGLTVGFLVLALNSSTPRGERVLALSIGGAYGLAALAVGTMISILVHRRTLRWLARGLPPTEMEARRALRTPIDVAIITGGLWLFGALAMGLLFAGLGGSSRDVLGFSGGLVLAGLSTAGVSYLLVARFNRQVTALALAYHPPQRTLIVSVRTRLLLIWLLTTGIPVLGIIFILSAPRDRTHVRGAGIGLAVVALAVGALATSLAARSIGAPLRELVTVLRTVGGGSLEADVLVDDAGEIGMLQNGVNEMIEGLRERDRINDMFGRHVGPAVAQAALRNGVTLSGETRQVVALFVDITASTELTRRTDPQKFVAMLNRFFGIVVEAVESAGGLVNKFEGDAALCVFGAPADLDDPATAALSAARRIRDEVLRIGEVSIGIGVAHGPVVAGQIGAASRLEYTVIGDAVNEASRLTDMAKKIPQALMATGAVYDWAGEQERRHWREAAPVQLRGRDQPTRTYISPLAG
ncbi:MAG: adenylate/guanylate cyclase domain-containing protein [Actinomycetota bacterium]|nr:adenylate/guanylate cyclase domain-containing protein [Actinomycetota bacterium]